MARYRTLLFVGAPGSGKGTQGKALGMLPEFFHCACGDVFRNVNADSPLGKTFRQYSLSGRLVPDDVTMALWLAHISAKVADGSFVPETTHLVLDGIPRNLTQARVMESHIDVEKVFHMNSPEEVLLERLRRRALKEGRPDDAQESVIRRRLEVFQRESQPLLEYYSKDRVVEIQANRSPQDILRSILSALVTPSRPAAAKATS